MRVVDRTLQLLEALGEDASGVGVTKLAEQLRDAPSTVHRLLAVLVQHRLVIQDPDSKRYRLGPGVLRLGEAYLRQNSLISVAQPHLAAVRSRTSESVFLTEFVNGEAICVATAESPRQLRFFIRIGQRMPYHAAASAKAILAFRPPEEAEVLLRGEALQRFTQTTPTGMDEILAELDQVRQDGYAACDEDMEIDVVALAVPIRDATGETVGSLALVAPKHRLSGVARDAAVTALREEAGEISSALGHRPSLAGDDAPPERGPVAAGTTA